MEGRIRSFIGRLIVVCLLTLYESQFLGFVSSDRMIGRDLCPQSLRSTNVNGPEQISKKTNVNAKLSLFSLFQPLNGHVSSDNSSFYESPSVRVQKCNCDNGSGSRSKSHIPVGNEKL